MLLLELGYPPIDNRGVDLVFQVVSARYESESIVLATNREFHDRGKIIDVAGTHRRWVDVDHRNHWIGGYNTGRR